MTCEFCENSYRYDPDPRLIPSWSRFVPERYCQVCGRELLERPLPPKPPVDECPYCGGSGKIHKSDDSYSQWSETCSKCGGTGKKNGPVECPWCLGDGTIERTNPETGFRLDTPCSTCHGEGLV